MAAAAVVAAAGMAGLQVQVVHVVCHRTEQTAAADVDRLAHV